MKAFITGATGFVGGRLAERLRERGDEVVCLVRSPGKAAKLESIGCTLVAGDLKDAAAIEKGMEGCDAVFHVAADYRVGLKASSQASMTDTNVGGTTRVLDVAAATPTVKKVVYVSSLVVNGNTRGQVVDETYVHPRDGYTSHYEKTKFEAHEVAEQKAAAGVPVVIVQPGSIYGKGDVSVTGGIIRDAARGKLPMVSFADTGFTMVHVDDVVDGILAAYEKGRVGESYHLGGESVTMRGLVDAAAEAGGKKPPRINMPSILIKASVPIAPLVTKAMGLPPNLKELISTSDGVTFYGSHDKAAAELGYSPRDLRTGLRDTV
jgi:nucleoside-diphosphate-sugar epimerase